MNVVCWPRGRAAEGSGQLTLPHLPSLPLCSAVCTLDLCSSHVKGALAPKVVSGPGGLSSVLCLVLMPWEATGWLCLLAQTLTLARSSEPPLFPSPPLQGWRTGVSELAMFL